MPAQKPQRPDPGHAMLLPRTGADPAGNTVQRAFDAVSAAQQQVQRSISGSPGRLLAPPALLTGAGAGTMPDGTCMVRIRGIGQGGGGGGASSAVGTAGGGAGGSTGEIVEAVIGEPGGAPLASTYSWVAGSGGGAGGTALGGNGQAGGDSTFTAAGVVYTAKGGAGGTGSVGQPTGNWAPNAPATGTPAVGTSGVLRRTYGVGDDGQSSGGAVSWFSGDGGCSEFGSGGLTVGGVTPGNPGGLYGGGGSGGAAGPGSSAIGGAGAAGAWIVEFYS